MPLGKKGTKIWRISKYIEEKTGRPLKPSKPSSPKKKKDRSKGPQPIPLTPEKDIIEKQIESQTISKPIKEGSVSVQWENATGKIITVNVQSHNLKKFQKEVRNKGGRIVNISGGRGIYFSTPSTEEIKNIRREQFDISEGVVPADFRTRIDIPKEVEYLGLKKKYISEAYEDYLGMNEPETVKKEGHTFVLSGIGTDFEQAYREKYRGLPDYKKFEYGLKFGDLKEKPIHEQIKYEGAAEYFKRLPKTEQEQKLKTYIKSPEFEKYLKSPKGETEFQAMKESLYYIKTHQFGKGWWETELGPIPTYPAKDVKREIAKLKLSTSEIDYQERFFEKLHPIVQERTTITQALASTLAVPVTLPQIAVKHFHKGKTVFLPDIAKELEKRTISPAEGAISGGIGYVVSGGKSDFLEQVIKKPKLTGIATATELIGFKMLSTAFKPITKPVMKSIKGTTADFGRYSIDRFKTIGKRFSTYSGKGLFNKFKLPSKFTSRLQKGKVGKDLVENIKIFKKGGVKGKEIPIKTRVIKHKDLMKDKVDYATYMKHEKFAGFGKKIWMTQEEVAKYKAGTTGGYMFKTIKKPSGHLDVQHLLERWDIGKPKGRFYHKVQKMAKSVEAKKTYDFRKYIPEKMQLKEGKYLFKPKIDTTITQKGLGSYYKDLIKPMKLKRETLNKMFTTQTKGKGFTMTGLEVDRSWVLKAQKINPFDDMVKDTKWALESQKTGSISKASKKLEQLNRGFDYIKRKKMLSNLEIEHYGDTFVMKDYGYKGSIAKAHLVKGGKFPAPEQYPQMYGAKWGTKSSSLAKAKTIMNKQLKQLKQDRLAQQTITPKVSIEHLKLEKAFKTQTPKLLHAQKVAEKFKHIRIPLSKFKPLHYKAQITGGLAKTTIKTDLQTEIDQSQIFRPYRIYKLKPKRETERIQIPFKDVIRISIPQIDTKMIQKPMQKQKIKQSQRQSLKLLSTYKTIHKMRKPSQTPPPPKPPSIRYKTKFKIPIFDLDEKIKYRVKKKIEKTPFDEIYKFRKAEIKSPFKNLGGMR